MSTIIGKLGDTALSSLTAFRFRSLKSHGLFLTATRALDHEDAFRLNCDLQGVTQHAVGSKSTCLSLP